MNYSFLPSLKRVGWVKIASTLWNQDYIRTLTTYYCFTNLRNKQKKWQKLEDKVKEKVLLLPLPDILKKEILALIKPIGLEILRWMKYHVSEDSPLHIVDLPKEFSWTSRGTIDRKKTAETLIKDESLAVVDRFLLACIYCLENDIPKLWSNTPPHIRNELCCKLRSYPNVMHRPVLVFWIYKITGVVIMDNSTQESGTRHVFNYQGAFLRAADSGNKEATEYFLSKLTSEQRTESLVARAVSYAANRYTSSFPVQSCIEGDVLCFLLSRMDNEQQREVLRNHSKQVLDLLLIWPWQEFFIKTANLLWDFLHEFDYKCLLEKIVGRIKDGFKDYNYQELFSEFWLQSPNAHKRYAMDEFIEEGGLLYYLYAINDQTNLKLILKDSNFMDMEKDKLDFIYPFCLELINDEKWDFLKFFIRECISSRNEMIRFKEEFISFVMRVGIPLERKQDKYNKFFQLLNASICGFDKRKIEEDNGSPAKRHHTEFEEVSE